MLYITTRNNVDTYTSRLPLLTNTAQDGGLYIPYRIPQFTPEQIIALKDISFSQTVANVLNMFFSCRLSALDIEFTIGKNPINLVAVNHRVVFAELWRNLDGSFAYMTQQLHERLLETDNAHASTDWSKTAVLISVLFGIYGKLLNEQIIGTGTEFDISVPADDFLMPMSVWYARRMGLPIKTIICACDEINNIWDLFHRGVFATNQVSDSLQLGLEKIIALTLGAQELHRFRTCCSSGSIYAVNPEDLKKLNDGIFCSVAGKNRAGSTINSVYRTNSYIIDPATALCYGGSQDYRASTANSRPVVLLAQQTPLDFVSEVIAATGITQAELLSTVRR